MFELGEGVSTRFGPEGRSGARGHTHTFSRSPDCRLAHRRSIEQKVVIMTVEYLGILIYLVFSCALALLIIGLSFVFSVRKPDPEKISAYECGFDPFDDARSRFDIRFYLVAILFIIFDLEVTFLFPWAMILNRISFFGFWSMMVFLIILTIGFLYEWKKGALNWS